MWVDDVLLTGRGASIGFVNDGKVLLDDNFILRGLQLLYVDNAQVSTSTNGDGFAVGYQFDDIEVWDGLPGNDNDNDQFPYLAFQAPTTSEIYSFEITSNTTSINITGTASDDNAINTITYTTNNGQTGNATSTNGFATWSVPITINQNETVVTTITVTDNAGQSTSKTMTITANPPAAPVGWDATVQTNDSSWTDSGVTYCVRLLIQGNNIQDEAGQIALGFQGRSSGSYTIRNVSIAERDPLAAEGDVIDATWKQVTFDGTAWSSTVSVAQGTEKKSDTVAFHLQPGTDYYVTFKIDSPSVYLDPPTGYRELYFSSADHTGDIDWSGNGFSVTQDYHALSKIYILAPAADLPPPAGFQMVQ